MPFSRKCVGPKRKYKYNRFERNASIRSEDYNGCAILKREKNSARSVTDRSLLVAEKSDRHKAFIPSPVLSTSLFSAPFGKVIERRDKKQLPSRHLIFRCRDDFYSKIEYEHPLQRGFGHALTENTVQRETAARRLRGEVAYSRLRHCKTSSVDAARLCLTDMDQGGTPFRTAFPDTFSTSFVELYAFFRRKKRTHTHTHTEHDRMQNSLVQTPRKK